MGGIAGQSISHIKNSYAKCTVSGGEYVAGIVGYGYGIENCCAMIKVKEAEAFLARLPVRLRTMRRLRITSSSRMRLPASIVSATAEWRSL